MQQFYVKRISFLRFIAPVFFILFYQQSSAQVFTIDSIMRNGPRANRINIAYLSDGFQSPDLPVFVSDASTINYYLFNTTPFLEYKNFFNSFAVEVPSNDAGTIHPATAADESYSNGMPAQPVSNPDTYFKSTFDYNSVHRLIVPGDNTAIHNVLAANLPDYDQVIMVANSQYYGGSGSSVCATTSTSASSIEVAIHELGHSFAGLADEYWISLARAAEKPNMTADNDAATVKWKDWIGLNSTGIYAYGYSGDALNWYRPSPVCKMQSLGNPFCSVCTQRFIDKIHQDVNMIDDFTPKATAVTLVSTDSIPVSVSVVQTVSNSIAVNWYLNDSLYSTGTSVKFPYSVMNNGANIIRAEAVDNTLLSKSYLPASGYINTVTWTLNKAAVLPLKLKTFSGLVKNGKGILHWEVSSDLNADHFELLKSHNEREFSTLANTKVNQNATKYDYTDINLLNPACYYKLKIVGKDGSFSYSPVVKLQNAADDYSYKIYQDAGRHKYRLTAGFENEENVSFTVADASGKIIIKKDFGKVNNQLNYNFDLSVYPAGVYFIKLNIHNSLYTAQLLAD